MPIILALFLIPTIFYGWKAWRGSPRYSPKATIEIGSVLLASLALVIGFVRLLGDHLPRRSAGLFLFLAMAVIATITLGLTAVILRITDGPASDSPALVEAGNDNRRKLYPWLLGTGIALFALLSWGAVAAPASEDLPFILAAMVLILGASSLGSLYIKARRTDYAIAGLMRDSWVHWQPASGPSETCLGPDGLLCEGEYTPWLASGNYLIQARAERGFLVLTFEKFYFRDSTAVTIRVPIPEGRETDMEFLQAKLRARCPRAHIALC